MSLLRKTSSTILSLLLCAGTALAQSGTTVTGRVTNEHGAPISNATVRIASVGVGAYTDEAGTYRLVVPAARAAGQTATMIARVVGYTSQTATLTLASGGTLTQNFALASNPLRLNEVVVTGSGTSTTRERLTTTINTVDSSALRRVTQPQNLVSALAAQAPNVEVRTQSGEPGASASIKIRGASSLSGTNQPLFVVDGQPIDNSTVATGSTLSGSGTLSGANQGTVTANRASDINPADIESVEILKSAAAAAIYGARAANGVVLITTKRGHAGQTHLNVNSTETVDNVYAPNLLQRTFTQGLGGVSGSCSTPNCTAKRWAWGPAAAAGTPMYNHETELFDTGLTADNNIQLSGGTDHTTFFASGGLTGQDGYLKGPNNKYNRATIRLKGTQDVASNLNIGGNLSYIDTRGKYVQKGSNLSGVMLGALRTPPSFNDQNSYTSTGLQRPYRFPNPTSSDELNAAVHYDNPFFVLDNAGNRSELGRSISNVNADWNPLGWLNVKYTLGGDYYNDWRLETTPTTSGSDPLGNITRNSINNLEIDHNLVGTARHSFGSALDATFTVGQNLNSRRVRQTLDLGEALVAPTPYNLQNTVNQQDLEYRALRHIEAYFGQAELDFLNQFVVNVGARNDGYSTFGPSNRRASYPKASAAWTFSNLVNHGDASGIFSYGKVHVAYGETGKEPPAYGFVTSTVLPGANYALGGWQEVLKGSIAGVPALGSNNGIGNTALRPERDRETEFGGDFAFFNSRIDMSATYYDKRSTDVILQAPINAAANGAIVQLLNAASIVNQGTELVMNLHPLRASNATWDIGVQFGRNHGLVRSLDGAQFISYNLEGFNGAIGSSTVGFAPGVIRGADFARCGRKLNLDGVDIDAGCGNAAPGALYLGADGLPVEDPTQRVIADPNPKYTMSYNTSVRLWNKLSMSGLLDVRKGGSVWNGTRGILNYFGTSVESLDRTRTDGQFGKNFLTNVYPVVAGPGAGVVAFKTPTDWQNWYLGLGGGFGPVSAPQVEDGSFVKLRELSISYTLDQPFVRSLTGFSTADVRFAGRNLKTWTRYTGFDPEANLGGGEFLTQGIDYFNNPQTRSFVVSVSLNR